MKKKAILFLGVICGLSLHAQENVKTLGLTKDMSVPSANPSIDLNKSKSNAVIWTEDFSNGIPSSWTNAGSAPNALWEYRGASTTPDLTVGSRGAYAGSATIASPTASNGFVIFDSDYLDNNGNSSNMGGGVSPTPHVGVLETGTIDLTGHPYVMLTVHSYMRYFAGRTLVAFSTDGGNTFTDTVRLYSDVSVNASTSTNEVAMVNISPYVGNSSNVVMAFIYDGNYNEPGANGLGYYFWMMDDLEISTLPNNMFRFTNWNSAPAQDMIYGTAGDPKVGHMNVHNTYPVSFDANVLNFGVKDQVNVQLEVEILHNGVQETVLTSPVLPLLASGDTANYNDLYTPQFTPTKIGKYEAVFSFKSDSIPAQAGAISPVDTAYTFYVTDSITSLDFGFIDNTIGTPNLGDDGSALASSFYFKNPVPGTANALHVNSLDVYFSSSTVDGGDIQIEIYDTTGFTFGSGFGTSPLATQSYTVTAAFPGTMQNLPIPVTLPVDAAYYFVVYMYSNAGANPIRIANDQSVDQPGATSIMYSADDAAWYSTYSGTSRSFESPIIRVIAEYDTVPAIDTTGSINEYANTGFSVYPNPSNGSDVTVEIDRGGDYTLNLINMVGQVVRSSDVVVNGSEKLHMDYSSVNSGIYILELKGENGSKTVRLTIN